MTERILSRYSGAVPRYTSYPTAPHFHEGVDCGIYSQWLGMLGIRDTLSLYIHIPYCDRLCWFCACHTKHTLRYEPIATYLESLKKEIAATGALVSRDAKVSALHFGGGSPTMLRPADMSDLMHCLREAFNFAPDAEISVEMDPNDLDDERYDALAAVGMTRASLGVQDFNPVVQKSINRIQTFEQTRSVAEAVRARGVHSVNCDVLYGLPFQTQDTLRETMDSIISIDPDRVALFGYAHVPWMKKHQTLIPEHALPDMTERYRQMTMAGDMLRAAGYQSIGIDHFAKETDSLAVAARNGRLRRNFQGYTDDQANALIGLGASSISRLPQGYIQNMTATGEYQRMVDTQGLAAVKGLELSQDDHLRAHAIERIMCDFRLDFDALAERFPEAGDELVHEARSYAASDCDGLVELDGSGMALTPTGRIFARSVAAVFDRYLANGKGRHSVAV